MDIARFHFAVDAIVKDLKKTKADDQLANLINSLSAVGNNPGHPQFIDQYKNQLEITRGALNDSVLNDPKMELYDLIDQLCLKDYIGNGLFKTIIESISENQIAPHAAVQSLQLIKANFSKKLSNLEAVKNSFSILEVPYDGVGDGDSEIEIKIPAVQGVKTLNDLAIEAKEWHRDLGTISEIFDPNRSEATVRTLATGSWQFYLASAPLVIFGVAKCLRGVNEVLTELIKTKNLLKSLIETNAPKDVVENYEKHLNESVSLNLSKLANNLVGEYYKGGDAGRKAELTVALTQSLKRLSKKISEGSKVSLRITKPATIKAADPENCTPEEQIAIEAASKVEEVRLATLLELDKVAQLEHDPDIVKSLPPPENDQNQ